MGRKPKTDPNAAIILSQHAEDVGDFAIYPNANTRNAAEVAYCGLELAGEVGEIANALKKAIRDDHFGKEGRALTPSRRLQLVDEAGDSLWAWCRLVYSIAATPDEVARHNIAKLEARFCDPESPTYSETIAHRRSIRRKRR